MVVPIHLQLLALDQARFAKGTKLTVIEPMLVVGNPEAMISKDLKVPVPT